MTWYDNVTSFSPREGAPFALPDTYTANAAWRRVTQEVTCCSRAARATPVAPAAHIAGMPAVGAAADLAQLLAVTGVEKRSRYPTPFGNHRSTQASRSRGATAPFREPSGGARRCRGGVRNTATIGRRPSHPGVSAAVTYANSHADSHRQRNTHGRAVAYPAAAAAGHHARAVAEHHAASRVGVRARTFANTHRHA